MIPELIGFQLAPDVSHVDPEVIGLVAVLRAPDLLEELPLGDQLAAVAAGMTGEPAAFADS